MMIVMKEGATEEQIQAVVDRVESVGCSAHVSPHSSPLDSAHRGRRYWLTIMRFTNGTLR